MSITRLVLRISGSFVMAMMIAVFALFFFGIFFAPVGTQHSSEIRVLPFAIAMVLVEGVYVGWLLCIGLVSNAKSESSLRTAPKLASTFFPIAVAYIGWAPFVMFSGESPPTIVVPLHLFSMFVNFYILWFASRSIHASELKRPPTLKDYLSTFLLLWFAIVFPPAVKWTHERVQGNIRRAA